MLSPEKGRRDRRDSRGDEREGHGRKRNRNEREETEEIKNHSPLPYLLQGLQALLSKPVSVGRPGDMIHDTFATPDQLNELVSGQNVNCSSKYNI